jgi:hypothetical protein
MFNPLPRGKRRPSNPDSKDQRSIPKTLLGSFSAKESLKKQWNKAFQPEKCICVQIQVHETGMACSRICKEEIRMAGAQDIHRK